MREERRERERERERERGEERKLKETVCENNNNKVGGQSPWAYVPHSFAGTCTRLQPVSSESRPLQTSPGGRQSSLS